VQAAENAQFKGVLAIWHGKCENSFDLTMAVTVLALAQAVAAVELGFHGGTDFREVLLVARASAVPAWQRALIVLTSTVVAVVIVVCLYWAQAILIPLGLAIFLTFLLAPVVRFVQRRGLGRTPAVLVVVLLAGLLLAGLVWLMAAQVTGLAAELPTHAENIKAKTKALRGIGQGTFWGSLDQLVQDVTGELTSSTDDGGSTPAPTPVSMEPQQPLWLSWVPTFARPLVEALAGGALALVLVVFMLLKREKLRDRMIWLVGQGRITLTTKALDEAGQRLSRYLFTQAVINGSFGVVFAAGLLVIGVKYALLWGMLAALLRYVPYIGSWVAALLPLVLSLALFQSWWPVLAVLVFFLVLELITANVVEPWLFGRSLGVSEVALLVAAAFWTFLWGPIGLVLSNPLMVCLVVLGKYVPHLEFLSVLVGDEPALEPEVSFYQRVLARDQDEATQLVLERVKSGDPDRIYDEVLVPALNYAKRDRARDTLTDADEQFVLQATREIVEDLGERHQTAEDTAARVADGEPSDVPKVRILGCPARDEADRLGLFMLEQVLDGSKWEIEISAVSALTAEVVEMVADKEPAMICIGALPPGGLAHTRYLCKRLKSRYPNARILVGQWGLKDNLAQHQERLKEAGAEVITTTLLETQNKLHALQPVLLEEQIRPTTIDTPEGRQTSIVARLSATSGMVLAP
jgi:predicted PurR-regulated permease PerM